MASKVNTNIRGYAPGEIPAKGCTTASILTSALGIPLQAFIDAQYIDSQTMSRRPGMILKYLPYRYDGITGKLLSGGSYLFDTYEHAKDYIRWAGEEFTVGEEGSKVPFTKQPMFESFEPRVWKVVGAWAFGNVQEAAIGRLQTWTFADDDAETKLPALYEALKKAASQSDAASVWLLHDPDTKSIGLQMGFKRVGGTEAENAAQALEIVEKDPTFTALVSDNIRVKSTFDRTSVLLTLWLPRSREAGGAELAIPYYPLVPDITHEYQR